MSVDFYWSLDGDYSVGEDGDIRDTSYDIMRSTWQEMRTRGRSNHYDWKEHPTLGANLEELIGQVNNRATAEEGKANLLAALTQGGFLPKNVIKIKYVPISKHRLFYYIYVNILDPSTGQTRLLKTTLLYDTLESEATIL
jgi:hypothetical protein